MLAGRTIDAEVDLLRERDARRSVPALDVTGGGEIGAVVRRLARRGVLGLL
jgi:hypothetical protein